MTDEKENTPMQKPGISKLSISALSCILVLVIIYLVSVIIGYIPLAWKNDKIIVYCGVGGYASAWWYIFSEVLNYPHVVFYDGSAEEWVRYNDMVLD